MASLRSPQNKPSEQNIQWMTQSSAGSWETGLLTVSPARQKTRKQMNSQINIAYSNYASAINIGELMFCALREVQLKSG